MYAQYRGHVLRWREPVSRADVSVRDVPSNLRRNPLVEVQARITLSLDISHGDKQSITIMLTLDTPSEPRIDASEPQAVLREAVRLHRRRQRRTAGVVVVIVLACAALVLVVAESGGGQQGGPAGKSELQPGSSRTSPLVPGSPRSLTANQYLLTQATVKIAVEGLGGAVTISALAQQWTSQDITCLQVAFGAPEFTSAAQRSAWLGTGLSVAPLNGQPQGFCSENIPGGGALASPSGSATHSSTVLPLGLGVVDVGGLPTDPSTLARDLEAGRTGALDFGVAQGSVENPGFERALILLRSPKLGETTAFRSALLQAMPLLHGVVRLGKQRTALGKVGIGFATGRSPGSPAVVLDARSGELLEAKNFEAGTLYRSVGMMSFWNPYAQSTESTGTGTVSLTMVGFNPLGEQSVVDKLPPYGFPT